jgi:hypothetical protein
MATALRLCVCAFCHCQVDRTTDEFMCAAAAAHALSRHNAARRGVAWRSLSDFELKAEPSGGLGAARMPS